MSSLIYVPSRPEGNSAIVYVDEQPPTITAETEWIYTKNAIDRWDLRKPVPKQFRKEAPIHWFENGWVTEKETVHQMALF